MKEINITKSYLSAGSGVHLTPGADKAACELARYCNEFALDMKRRRPEQFGYWASIPLPDVRGSLEEINYAFDHLDADGVVLKTNTHGTYLGDKSTDVIFNELNRRKAIVFMHPAAPCMPSGAKTAPITGYPLPMFEYFFETARAMINLFLSDTVYRCPNITWIIPHLGGAFPPLINRFASVGAALNLPNVGPHLSPSWVKERLNRQFYFDSAGWGLPEQMAGLLKYITPQRVLYGSDFPYTPLKVVYMLSDQHDQHLPELVSTNTDKEAICTGNALKLPTPRVKRL